MSDRWDGKRGTTLAARDRARDEIDPKSWMASKLKTFDEAIEQEPIPAFFLDLLEKLDSVERARTPGS